MLVTVGPFYDKTDGVTIETALTITNERITLTADTDAGSAPTNILDNVTGATSGTANDLNYITGNDAGMMQLELAAADVNRVGRMFLSITDAANHVPVFHEWFVLPQAIFDWLTGVIVPLPANVTQLLGTAWLTPGTAGTPDVNAKLWNGLTTVALPLVPTTAGRTLDVAATGEAGLDFDNIKAATGATTLTNITVPVVTTTGTATNLTNAPTNGDLTAAMKASVNAEADTALADVGVTSTVTGRIDAAITTRTKPADTQAAVTLVTTTTNLTTNGDKTGYRLSATGVDDILDETVGDSTITMRQVMKIAIAALAGKLSGAATTTIVIRNAADDTDVIVSAVDASGNRTAVTLTL